MIIIKNHIIPFKGYLAMCVFPFIFVRKDARNLTVKGINHEKILGRQQKELLLVGFYLWYGIEWLVKLCYYRNRITAYKNISFEREAYAKQSNITYLDERKPYAFMKYVINNNIN